MELKGSSSAERGVPHFPTGETLSCCQSVQEGAAGTHFTAFHLELFQYLYLFFCFLYVFLLIKKNKRRNKRKWDKREQLLSSIKFEGKGMRMQISNNTSKQKR